jgi:hypothetical protein
MKNGNACLTLICLLGATCVSFADCNMSDPASRQQCLESEREKAQLKERLLECQASTATVIGAKEVDCSSAIKVPRVLDASTQCANWNVEYQKQCASPPHDVPEFVANRLEATCGAAAKALVEACPKVASPTTPGTCSSSDSSSSCDVRAQQVNHELVDYLIRSLAYAGRCHYEIDECVIMNPVRQRISIPQ